MNSLILIFLNFSCSAADNVLGRLDSAGCWRCTCLSEYCHVCHF